MKKSYILLAFTFSVFPLISARKNLALLTPDTQSNPFILDNQLCKVANHLNSHLDHSILFNTSFLKNTRAVREHLTNPHTFNGKQKTVKNTNKKEIHYTYFNRKSDTLLVIAPGFPKKRESLAPFVEIFDSYDIVILDYRGFNFTERSWLNPFSWRHHPSEYIINVDGNNVHMGEEEEQDILSVVNTVKNEKKYNHIFGLGTCYSSIILAKAAATQPGMFEKLILDSCPYSIKTLVKKYVEDPKLLFTQGRKGGWESKWPFRAKWIQKITLWVAEKLCRIKFSKYKIEAYDYLTHLDIPILFIHGTNDALVPFNLFEKLWNSLPNKQKVALVTPYEHVFHHMRDKKQYKLICDLFFENNYTEFIDQITHPKKLIGHKLDKLKHTYSPLA